MCDGLTSTPNVEVLPGHTFASGPYVCFRDMRRTDMSIMYSYMYVRADQCIPASQARTRSGLGGSGIQRREQWGVAGGLHPLGRVARVNPVM